MVDFAVPENQKVKIQENEECEKYLDHAREQKKKAMEHESSIVTNCNCNLRAMKRSSKGLVRGLEELELEV